MFIEIQKNKRKNMQKNCAVFLFLILSIFFLECGKSRGSNFSKDFFSSSSEKEQKFRIRYFRTKRHSSRNSFRYVSVSFSDEIAGTSLEQNHSIRELERESGIFYKVYYFPSGRILQYEFFQGKNRKLYAKYLYRRAPLNQQKESSILLLDRIEYYNPENRMLAWERVQYNSFGQPIQTERYTAKGRSHIY